MSRSNVVFLTALLLFWCFYDACLVLKFIVNRNPYLHASHLGLLTDLLVDLLQLNL